MKNTSQRQAPLKTAFDAKHIEERRLENGKKCSKIKRNKFKSVSHTFKRLHHEKWYVCRMENEKLGEGKTVELPGNTAETKEGTLRQMREEQGRGVIRRCLFLFAPGKWEASGLTVREQLKSRRKESGCPSDTARNWHNGVRGKQSKDSPVVWAEGEEKKKGKREKNWRIEGWNSAAALKSNSVEVLFIVSSFSSNFGFFRMPYVRVGVKMRRKMARCNVNNVFEIRSALPGCVWMPFLLSLFVIEWKKYLSPGIFFKIIDISFQYSYISNYNQEERSYFWNLSYM